MVDEKVLISLIREAGAHHAAALPISAVRFERSFRALCEANTCRRYGTCYTCPPDAGDIDELIAKAKQYAQGILYQTVWPLEDSFDVEGMAEAGRQHTELTHRITDILPKGEGLLHLATGGCSLCPECAKLRNEPCVYPDKALVSVSAYGLHVSETAKAAGLKYNNGPNTVTFFGMVFFGRANKGEESIVG